MNKTLSADYTYTIELKDAKHTISLTKVSTQEVKIFTCYSKSTEGLHYLMSSLTDDSCMSHFPKQK